MIQNLVPMGKVCAGKSEAGKNKINTSFYMEEKQNNIIQTDTSKRNVISSLLWKFLERGGTQGVQFVLSVVLARLVSPADYGVIALILIFIQIATVFVQSGFNTALIQKRNADEVDFSSVLYMSLAVAAVMYAVLFFASPFIASFYGNSVLCPLVRVLSLTLFFGALNSVQSAYVSKTMQFRRFFFSSMGGALGSGIAGIILAYKGFGVWALVTQQLVNISLMCVILWFTVEWRPKLIFSLQRTKTLFCFGWKLLCSGLLDTVFRNIYGLLIGKIYNSTQLGYFNRGQQFPSVIATNLDGSIQSVMLPALSAHNDS
ncbi:MAG: lipopolysaccharide biosynthesis protein, partial [Spirochaetales bacterium]|nr:lipopolysaccharide biosynthesis protein [Spirochaetales bacterium]MDY5913735.1 lipopolysaccharide biosynthesis protein [Treponema sp.]